MAPASSWEKGSQLLSRVKTYYAGAGARYPPIDQSTAILLTISFTVLYVTPFYVSRTLRTEYRINRSSPTSIKAASRAAILTTLVCTIITVYILAIPGHTTPREIFAILGLYPVDFLDTAKCVFLVGILFVGPLFECGIVEGDWKYWGRWSTIKSTLVDSWIGWRNLVIAPLTEEIVWRSLAISLFLLAQSKPKHIVYAGPLIFGIAHFHHLNQFIIAQQRAGQSYLSAALTPSVIIPGLLRTFFQLTYTTLFGAFETFVFLRTGNLYSCILAHTFCNWMGLPRFWGRVGNLVGQEVSAAPATKKTDDTSGDEDEKSTTNPNQAPGEQLQEMLTPGHQDQTLGLHWTVGYYLLLGVGAFGFYKLLWPLTESKGALAYF